MPERRKRQKKQPPGLKKKGWKKKQQRLKLRGSERSSKLPKKRKNV